MERRPGDPTQPIRPPVPPQSGSTAPLRGPVGSPRRPSVSGRVVAGGLVALLAAFGIGFLAGNAGEEPQPAASGQQGEDGGGGGGGRGCRRAVAVAEQTIDLQRQALVNRTQFTHAALAGDEEQLLRLDQALEPISAQLQSAEQRLTAALERCRAGGKRRGGGGGDQGGGGGGGG